MVPYRGKSILIPPRCHALLHRTRGHPGTANRRTHGRGAPRRHPRPFIKIGVEIGVITIDTNTVFGKVPTTPHELRVQYPGAIYHLMSRRDRREDILADERDRERFVETLEET